MKIVIKSPQEDSSLVAECLEGNREAFGILVQRYQSLICALIYNRCGNIAQSEDLAQETFLAAWKSLAALRETAHFKEWLCQIARNLSANLARADSRKAHGNSSSMDQIQELADERPSPSAETMSREDEGVVWRTLEQLPETYRLPLILFHREGESVADVAAALDLSEDAVRQRLARGREMLRQEVSGMIVGVLERTKPGKKFTVGVLAAVGAAGGSVAKAAGIGVATNTVVAAKAAMGASNLIGLGALPLVGDLVLLLVFLSKARTPQERCVLKRQMMFMALTDVVFAFWMFGVIHFALNIWIWVPASAIAFVGFRWAQLFRAFRKAGWLGDAIKSSDGRSYRTGYAPGWQVRCPKCGLTVDAGAAGLIRLGAAGRSRRLGPCSNCKKLRWLIVERVKG